MAEILAQRVGDRILVADQQRDGAVQPLDALFGARRAVLDMGLPLAFENLASCGPRNRSLRPDFRVWLLRRSWSDPPWRAEFLHSRRLIDDLSD